MQTQTQRIGKLLQRKRGATSMEIIACGPTVSPHRRLADLKAQGWIITRVKVPGERYGRYHGQPPESCYFTAMGQAHARKLR
jgi:hypothetical protein